MTHPSHPALVQGVVTNLSPERLQLAVLALAAGDLTIPHA
jgi:hypothetical protein